MRTLLAFILVWSFASPVFAANSVINQQGVAGVPVSAGACSGGATEVIAGSPANTNWAIMPEGADIRCEVGTSANVAASPVPTATVGLLFKSNVLVTEPIGGLGVLRLDCCGVAGAVSVDTWQQ
jgi:hypothetical protein